MVETASLAAIARASKGDGAVMAVTFVVTVALDLVKAVAVGVAVAVLAGGALGRGKHGYSTSRSKRLPPTTIISPRNTTYSYYYIVAYRLEGPLFAAAHWFR
ncbi:hypothetical protein ACTAF0_09095 [Streptomyces murinus]|uniref:hypothetical protein n=1 Tax=Streptomyces murinus TaxID=33900 RepID=UPI003F452B20